MKKTIRLQKLIASCTSFSRRTSEALIKAGKVQVNGKIITKLGVKVDPEKDKILVNKTLITLPNKYVYIAYNKPKNSLVTKKDPFGRKTIWKDLKKWEELLNSVGRLDYDSEGLLLLTNDGTFINQLTHPKHNIEKVYNVKLAVATPSNEVLDQLRKGIILDDRKTMPARVKMIKKGTKTCWVEIIIHEGRNRQVRRMCKAVNLSVLRLKRVQIGFVKLGNLKLGMWRYLTKKELNEL